MESYPEVAPLWDLSQASTFSQLPDDDFLALLQKQFPNSNDAFNPVSFDTGIDPQSIQPFPLPGLSPPSDDSSPSPPSINNDSDSRSQSRRPRADTDSDDPMLKRKASDDSMDDEPHSKTQHTAGPDRRSSTSGRRKSGNGNPDESRLLKRKEQNRAAQRAFRERKEKHVKDLEDQVAALESKNQEAISENVNLRDLLARLQDENVTLKQAAFTFSVPKTAGSSQPVASGSGQSSLNMYNSPSSMSPGTTFASPPSVTSPTFTDGMDWTSLTTFDPAALNLLDESPPQTTATGSAMTMDFGFGSSNQPNKSPFTTIAANPMFMSFADFDTPPDTASDSSSSFNFDMWTNSPQPQSKEPGLDELFGGGNYLGKQGPVDFNVLMMGNTPSSLSPVAHRSSPGNGTSGSSSSSTSNSNHSESQSPISSAGTSPAAEEHIPKQCPQSREETAQCITVFGPSQFVTEPMIHRSNDRVLGSMVACKGSSLPSKEPKEDDVDVLTAWRGVTNDPHFKDADLNELCSEFSNKAKCDGSRVVVDGPTYQELLAKLASQQSQQRQ